MRQRQAEDDPKETFEVSDQNDKITAPLWGTILHYLQVGTFYAFALIVFCVAATIPSCSLLSTSSRELNAARWEVC